MGEKMPCRNLRAEMARKKVSIEDIAECLQIHRNSASNKVNGNTPLCQKKNCTGHKSWRSS